MVLLKYENTNKYLYPPCLYITKTTAPMGPLLRFSAPARDRFGPPGLAWADVVAERTQTVGTKQFSHSEPFSHLTTAHAWIHSTAAHITRPIKNQVCTKPV